PPQVKPPRAPLVLQGEGVFVTPTHIDGGIAAAVQPAGGHLPSVAAIASTRDPMRTLPAYPISPLARRLVPALVAFAALPSAVRAQQASPQPQQTSEAVGASAAADSLEAWRLPASALGTRCSDGIGRAHQAADNLLAAPPSEGTAFRRLQAIEQANA